MNTLIIDNYDSYTANLYQLVFRWYLANDYSADEALQSIVVIRNDSISKDHLLRVLDQFSCVVMSPGPGNPSNAADVGISIAVFTDTSIPVLGVCLGHQSMVHVFGGKVISCVQPSHGIIDKVHVVNSECLFRGFGETFKAVRYHSLCADPDECILPTAWTFDEQQRVLMGIRHKSKPFYGVQFHPESICSDGGDLLIRNFYELVSTFHSGKYRSHKLSEDVFALDVFPAFKTTKASTCIQPKISYTTLVTRVQVDIPDTEVLFELLNCDVWLDTARVNKENRFSVFCVPESDVHISYSAAKRLIVTKKEGSIVQESLEDRDTIFSWLSRFIAQYPKSREYQWVPKSREVVEELPFQFDCGLFGYFGYECWKGCDLFVRSHYDVVESDAFDASLRFVDRLLVYDHQEGYLYGLKLSEDSNRATDELVTFMACLKKKLSSRVQRSKLSAAESLTYAHPEGDLHRLKYLEKIAQCQDYIRQGESYELCLTTSWNFSITGDDLPSLMTLYTSLRQRNPAPYGAFYRFDNIHLMSTSPERFIKISRDGVISMKPIKGTIKRSSDAEEDTRRFNELKHSVKDIAENLMILDLIRNDLNTFCHPESVQVPRLMAIESYETVHQMVSEVVGKPRQWEDPTCNPLTILQSCFPPGSMTGAPKKRSVELLQRLEANLHPSGRRGAYSGVHGWIGLNKACDFSVIIRSITAESSNNTNANQITFSVGAGGAITILSDPEEEYREMELKANSVIPTLRQIYSFAQD